MLEPMVRRRLVLLPRRLLSVAGLRATPECCDPAPRRRPSTRPVMVVLRRRLAAVEVVRFLLLPTRRRSVAGLRATPECWGPALRRRPSVAGLRATPECWGPALRLRPSMPPGPRRLWLLDLTLWTLLMRLMELDLARLPMAEDLWAPMEELDRRRRPMMLPSAARSFEPLEL